MRAVLDDLHAGKLGDGHVVGVWADPESGAPAGWAYFAIDDKADRVWDLWCHRLEPGSELPGLTRRRPPNIVRTIMLLGRMHRRVLLRLTGGAALGVLVPRPLLGAELTDGERRRFAIGAPIRVPLDLDLPQGSYFGGLVYQRIYATVDEVMAIAGDPGSYTSILSAARESRVMSRSGRDMQVYLRHGEGLISTSYVILVRREAASLIRFWLDPSQPHDLDDGWGLLRVAPWPEPPGLRTTRAPEPSSVITWGVLLRIDATALKRQFSEQIRRYVMTTPTLIAATLSARRGGRPA